MNRRRALVAATLGLAAVGLAAASIPFFGSLAPSAAAGRHLPRIDVSDLEPGSYKYHVVGSDRYSQEAFLVIRRDDGQLAAYFMRLRDGKVQMPDLHWWSFGYVCSDFNPKPMKGRLAPNGEMRCADAEQGDWAQAQYRWDYSGKNKGQQVDDLYSPHFALEGHDLVIGKPS